jgi:restriction system protein
MSNSWKQYQDEAAAFFRSLGLEAHTDIAVQGVRTSHNVDVLAKSTHAGFEVRWIVECKHWKTAVSKLHVLALREIVSDVGADRGILLSEAGFQSGAIEAASLTNVHTTSLAELRETATKEITSMRLRELYDRVEPCRQRYWDIPKDNRIEHGLRQEVGQLGYSGARSIELAEDLLLKALREAYPIRSETLNALCTPGFQQQFETPQQLMCALEPVVHELEIKLSAYATKFGNTQT